MSKAYKYHKITGAVLSLLIVAMSFFPTVYLSKNSSNVIQLLTKAIEEASVLVMVLCALLLAIPLLYAGCFIFYLTGKEAHAFSSVTSYIAVSYTHLDVYKRQVIDSVILNDTSVANDVKTPVRECYVPSIIKKQTKRNVDLITVDVVQKGVPELREALRKSRDDGNQLIIVDAVSMEHVDIIAKACVELSWQVLAIDPGPFTMKLAAARGIANDTETVEKEIRTPAENKSVLIVAGSANPSTKRQMEVLFEMEKDAQQVSVSAERLLEDSKEHELEVARNVKQLSDILSKEERPRVILVETALHGEIVDLQEEDEKHGYDAGGSSERINRGLAEITEAVLEGHSDKIAGMMLTGGDTMESVCRKINTTYIQAIDNIVAQVDVGRLAGAYEGMPIVVKGGFCGYDEVGADIVKRILEEANQ